MMNCTDEVQRLQTPSNKIRLSRGGVIARCPNAQLRHSRRKRAWPALMVFEFS
jgi:hypothetical protein